MFLPLILVLISSLLILSLNSTVSLKVGMLNASTFKEDKLKEFINQEKMVKEAVDSYCRVNFTACLGNNSLNVATIQSFSPIIYNNNFSLAPFQSIIVDKNTKTIQITSKFNEHSFFDYTHTYLNKDSNLSCDNNQTIQNCSTLSIIKYLKMSEELQIKYNQKDISDLQLQQSMVSPEESAILQIQINSLQAQIVDLNNSIQTRKISGF